MPPKIVRGEREREEREERERERREREERERERERGSGFNNTYSASWRICGGYNKPKQFIWRPRAHFS